MLDSKQEKRIHLYHLMGDLPSASRKITTKVISVEEREAYVLEKLLLDLNGIEMVPAYFVRPKGAHGKMPVVLYNHAHGGNYTLGKDELIAGRSALQSPPYADTLALMNYAALCIDSWAFGERSTKTESAIFKEMLWNGQVMWGMMVFDSLRAIDYLVTRPDVDPDRIGTVGISMGSTMAWWTTALDERVKVCIDICCMTDFQALIDNNGLDLHGVYYYIPGLLKHFTTAEINALIVPRPHLSLAGNLDSLTPPEGLARVDQALQQAYKKENAADAWKMLRYDVGHVETPEMRKEVLSFFSKWL